MNKPKKRSQKEISQSQFTPYLESTTKPKTGKKRAEEISFKNDNVKPIEIGFEDIDIAIIYFLNKILKLKVEQDNRLIDINIVFKNPENWVSYQKEGIFRDNNGKIMLPVMVLDRKLIERNKSITSKVDHKSPLNYYVYGQKYSKQNTYNQFDILTNTIPEKTFYATVMPEYVNISYDVILECNYIHQLNKIIEEIAYSADSYWGEPEKFQFLTMIKNFSPSIEMDINNERVVKCQFEIIIKGYIVPNTLLKTLKSIQKYNNYSKVSINFTENT